MLTGSHKTVLRWIDNAREFQCGIMLERDPLFAIPQFIDGQQLFWRSVHGPVSTKLATQLVRRLIHRSFVPGGVVISSHNMPPHCGEL